MSWIHFEDFVRAISWLIEHDTIDGVVNLASPHPLPNAEFMRILREAAGVPIGLPTTRWMLEIGRPDADRAGAHSQEPSRGAGSPSRTRVHLQVPALA
jgi:NAD dependent epimerase/dehydratase family enzyme